jgi:tetratricopeptide (TPR) repeat protein
MTTRRLAAVRCPLESGAAILAGVLLLNSLCRGAEPLASATSSVAQVEGLYREARSRWHAGTNSAEAAWHFARACFDRAEFATNDTQRAALAEEGIAASKRALALAPDSAAARLYLGMNLGQLARTKLFTALHLLDEMEATWKKAIELDAKFDHAGAHRSLGLLYLDAPGWPLSLGSRAKARQHLKKAVELCPDYPGNQLCWLEALLKWDEMKAVRAQIDAVEVILQTARGRLAGEEWKRDWEEWDARWKKIKARAAVAPVRSPKGGR